MDREQQDLVAVLERRVSDYGERLLYSFLDRNGLVAESLSYRQLFDSSLAVAAEIQRRGLQREPVALLYPHSVDFIIAFFGAIMAGAYPMPLTKPRGRDWRSIVTVLKASQARAILMSRSKAEHIPTEILQIEGLALIHTDAIDAGASADWRRPDVQPDDIAFVQYTSGSTSQPKGVAITHRNIVHNSEQIRVNFGNTANDIGIGWLPFFHDMGLIGHIIQPLYTGIYNYFLSPIAFISQPIRWLEAISRYGGTISGGPNFAYELCCNKVSQADIDSLNLSTWRIAYCGAEKVSPKTAKTFLAKFSPAGMQPKSFYSCYGMAESTLFVCGRNELRTLTPPSGTTEYVSVGSIAASAAEEGVDIKIVNTNSLAPVAEGQVGEICVKSASTASGYYCDPESSSRIFDQTIAGSSGYLRTGDLGFLSDGNLYFVGRQKNLLKLRGTNYHAEDIEDHIWQRFAETGIARCVAFAIEHEERDALVVLLENAGQLSDADQLTVAKSVHAEICQSIGIIPHRVVVTQKNSLPLTTSGKPQRALCKQRLAEGAYA